MLRFLIIAAAVLIQAIYGFVPHTPKQRAGNSKFLPANFVSAAAPTNALTPSAFLRMATDGEDSNVVESKISPDGTFYDDEIDSAPQKAGISDSMKARLIAEASTGLDSNQKQTNVILYIVLGVAILVVLGGAGIFY